METNNVEMTPEVVETGILGSKPNFWGVYVIAGAAMAWTGFIFVPVYKLLKSKIEDHKQAKFKVVKDEE